MSKFPGSPQEDYVWGKEVERKLALLDTASRNLNALVTSNNSRVGALFTAQQQLSAQQAVLETTQNDLLITQGALSVAQSGLLVAQTELQKQVDFLAHQTVSAESYPEDLTTKGPYSSQQNYTWIAYNETADASITLVIPQSGKLAVQAGGYLSGHSNNYATATCFIGIESLYENGTVHSEPYPGDGNYLEVWGSNTNVGQAGSGHLHVRGGFPPGETMTFRCRRGFNVRAGSSGYSATFYFQGTSLSISKIGM